MLTRTKVMVTLIKSVTNKTNDPLTANSRHFFAGLRSNA